MLLLFHLSLNTWIKPCSYTNLTKLSMFQATIPIQSVASVRISPIYGKDTMKYIDFTAIVVPKVTCELLVSPIPYDSSGLTSLSYSWQLLCSDYQVESICHLGLTFLLTN